MGTDTCGPDHACHECMPTQTPDVVCQPDSCGHYLDDCGNLQTCVPMPNSGQQCPSIATNNGPIYIQYCSSGDPPYVPYEMPTPDWTQVGSCLGCHRSQQWDGLCGNAGNAFACPDSYLDGIQDNTETDIDCGGFNPTKCGVGQACLQDSDCLEERCISGICAHTNLMNPGCINTEQITASGNIVCCP